MTEEDTLNRLRRKDFLEVFEMLTAELMGGASRDRRFSRYIRFALIWDNKEFIVHENLFPIIKSAYWRPEDFIQEGQRRLDEAFAEVS